MRQRKGKSRKSEQRQNDCWYIRVEFVLLFGIAKKYFGNKMKNVKNSWNVKLRYSPSYVLFYLYKGQYWREANRDLDEKLEYYKLTISL